jgi:hypothetical protein
MEDLFGRDSLSKALRERVSEPILTLAKAELAEVLRAPALVGYGVKADKQKRGWNMEPLQSESSESLCSRVTTAKKHNPTLNGSSGKLRVVFPVIVPLVIRPRPNLF